ncbi:MULTISPECIES: alpha/beta fold hydrolase [Mycolicibacterium]|uniref:AB hydrolase-1 domain-containing protein n=1 Tax=Mycolicibacterium llatzerense TaxID=280871 RepID=A0A0D1L0S5_9MYCO|nr:MULTISPECIES: alpha/beta hydrolase [Mycolicibacterium]KIU14625.1 hypothetical protein TL10_23460 [Mycolicibacterium llatzerense]MCT7372056.1 hypothetical protein [Mycolicibacterium llatzerense]WGI35762.1 alpha/beta hydrolase [Mycolicibacterium aubagnense]
MTVCTVPHAAPAARSVHQTILTRDGVSLSVHDSGPVDAEHTVALLHGLCQGAGSWQVIEKALHELLGGAVRVIRYDHRGHGDSSCAPMSTYHVDQLADDFTDVLMALRVSGSLTVAGHSLGGMAAMSYSARSVDRQPVRPQGLVLVATAAGRLCDRGLGRLLSTPAPDFLSALVAHTPAYAAEHAVRALARPVCELVGLCRGCARAERRVLCAMCSAALSTTALSTAAGFLPHLRRFDQRAVLGNIGAATTILSGAADTVTPAAHAYEMASAIPGARHRQFHGAGHMLLHERPMPVADEIAAVVRSLRTVVSGVGA